MLLIPAENGFNKSNLPWLTFALILLNILAYLFLQDDDIDLYFEAVEYYQDEQMLALEKLPFEKYSKKKRPDIYLRLISNDISNEELIQLIIFDKRFTHELTNSSAYSVEWKNKRVPLNEIMGQSSTTQYAFYPSEPSVFTAFTHMFMHGSIDHLIGNIIFLFLFGYNLELLIGKGKTLLAYFLSGLGAVLFFAYTTNDKFIPLVGASGAISGLMGGFAGYYGLKQIRYFYWIFVFFNYIKLPALLVLIYWLLKEFISSGSNDGVAYMAHFGGLVVGAASVFLIKHFFMPTREEPQVARKISASANNLHSHNNDYSQAKSTYQSSNEEQKLHRKASKAIKELDFERAKGYFHQLLDKDSSNKNYISSLYNIEKQTPTNKSFSELAERIINLSLSQDSYQRLSEKVIHDLKQLFNSYKTISADTLIAYCQKQSLLLNTSLIRPVINFLIKEYDYHEKMPDMLLHFALSSEATGDRESKIKVLNFIVKKYPLTFAAKEANVELKNSN